MRRRGGFADAAGSVPHRVCGQRLILIRPRGELRQDVAVARGHHTRRLPLHITVQIGLDRLQEHSILFVRRVRDRRYAVYVRCVSSFAQKAARPPVLLADVHVHHDLLRRYDP